MTNAWGVGLRRRLSAIAMLLAAGAALAAVSGAAVADELGPRWATGSSSSTTTSGEARVIVKFRSDATLWREASADEKRETAQFASTMSTRLGVSLSNGRALGERVQVLRSSATGGPTSSELASLLAADPDVEYAVASERRYLQHTPNDPLYANNQDSTTPKAGQWYLRAPTTTFRSATNAQTAWDTTLGKTSVVVAVLDTGLRRKHEDLAGQSYAGYDFISRELIANDGDGRDSSAYDPGDWVTQSDIDTYSIFSGCSVTDSSWHGTQVSGIIAAIGDNGIGMTGIAPNVRLLPVRVLGKCGGWDDDIIAGMLWAGGLSSSPGTNSHPARVINMSLGATGSCSSAYSDATKRLYKAGVVVVAAAGNSAGAVSTPANCPGVIAVAALRHDGTKAGYSNYGSAVDISAPGGNCGSTSGSCLYPILSTTNTGTTKPVSSSYTNGTDYAVGTSFSSPLVAGTAALMLSVNPDLTPKQVLTLLRSSASSFPTSGSDDATKSCSAITSGSGVSCYCTTSTCGAGMLDASAAVAAAKAAAE